MKITDLETFVVGTPPPHKGGAFWVFVKLTTDHGISGIGEVYAVPFAPEVVEKMIGDVFQRHVVGMDPLRIEHLWRRVYSAGYTQRADVSVMGILSGLECALWDIIGKERDCPVYDLLGGRVHERLRSYTYIYPERPEDLESPANVYTDPDLAAERALFYADKGFTALKFDPAGDYTIHDPRQLRLEALDRSERFVRRLREALGMRVDLLFGTHGQMTASSALRLARRLEPYDPLWLEEPVPPEQPEQMARVARATSIPIATGERLAGKHEFARLLQLGAASILQFAMGRVGGLWEGKKIASMAEAFGAQIAPHLYCGPVEAAANIHLDMSAPNFLIQESIEEWGGFHSAILTTPLRWEDGYILAPTAPGLGVELNETVARQNPYKGKRLHLEMQDQVL